MKKPFKETKLGKFINSKGLDAALGIGGSIFPPLALIDELKDNLMGSTPSIALTEDEKKEFLQYHAEYLKELELTLQDAQNARTMYIAKSEMTDRVAKWVMRWNLPITLALIGVLVWATFQLQNNVLLALISSAIGSLITQLTSERSTIINFFFGSSMGSKNKADIINKMQHDTDNK